MLLCYVTLGRLIGGYLCFGGKHSFHLRDEVVRRVYRNAIRHCGIKTQWFKTWRSQDLLFVDGGRKLYRNIGSRVRHGTNGVRRRDFGQVLVSSGLSNFHQDKTEPVKSGIAQWYSDSLRAGRFGDRIPVVARFSAPVQSDPGAHPASYTMGSGSVPGVTRQGRGVDHPPHLAPRLKKE